MNMYVVLGKLRSLCQGTQTVLVGMHPSGTTLPLSRR